MTAKPRKRVASQTQTVTSGTTIRFEVPSSDRKAKPNPALLIAQEVNPVGGFVGFLREYAVVGLAIGFIIGLQAQDLVKSLVASFINPAFNLFFGQALNLRTFTLHFHKHVAEFHWGAFVYTLLNFLFVLAAIYAIVKIFNLDKLNKPKKKDLAKMTELK